MTCYLMDADGENRTDELVAGQWIEHLWVNGQGIVARNVTEQVEGIYYTFITWDMDGSYISDHIRAGRRCQQQ